MAFAFEGVAALRLAAWLGLLAVGLWVWSRRPDAAGRAFAFWTVVWGGGIQAVLSLQGMASDPATQALLYRVHYYAIVFTSTATLALLLYAPSAVRRPRLPLAAMGGLSLALMLAFAASHGTFLVERVADGAYAADHAPGMGLLYHALLWTGFLAAMFWLGWKGPALRGPARASATWLMAGLALFAADRFARTWMWWVRDPATLPGGLDGMAYGFATFLYGPAVAWMVWRSLGIDQGANVLLAAMLGGALGATAIATYGVGGATTVGVAISALLGPLYGLLMGMGVLAAPGGPPAPQPRRRALVLAEG